jgi:hypothetical protein
MDGEDEMNCCDGRFALSSLHHTIRVQSTTQRALRQGLHMKRIASLTHFLFVTALLIASSALASPVSYVAELRTSSQNPVTNVLILEKDQSGTVHGTVYGSQLPEAASSRSATIPLYSEANADHRPDRGLTPEGAQKTQIIMFLNKPFADSIHGSSGAKRYRARATA